jgi:hypothetical protein
MEVLPQAVLGFSVAPAMPAASSSRDIPGYWALRLPLPHRIDLDWRSSCETYKPGDSTSGEKWEETFGDTRTRFARSSDIVLDAAEYRMEGSKHTRGGAFAQHVPFRPHTSWIRLPQTYNLTPRWPSYVQWFLRYPRFCLILLQVPTLRTVHFFMYLPHIARPNCISLCFKSIVGHFVLKAIPLYFQ